MARVLILGGGFGGLAVATGLRRRLPETHEIVLVDRAERFFIGLRKLWVLVGLEPLEPGMRSRDRLNGQGVRFVQSDIESIDPEARRVWTGAGALDGDHLVVALGAVPAAERVPGLRDHGHNLYDIDAVMRASGRLKAIDGGRIVVAIAGAPYKCPPAPYEAILLIDEMLRKRGARDAIDLVFTTFQPGLLPNVGPEGQRWLGERFSERGIAWHAPRAIERLEPGRIVYADAALECDLALVVPPHRPPTVVAGSPLAGEGGWIAVDRHALATRFPGVYAIGDVTHIPLAGGAALPKAGLFAEAEGERVAKAIAAEILDEPEPAGFDGRGYCYMELGSQEATRIDGDFYASGGPRVTLAGASEAHAEEKRRFESQRLARWLP